MPYLRLSSPALPIDQKQAIANNLIEITLRAFRLGADQRYQTSVQFVTLPQSEMMPSPGSGSECHPGFTLEVIGHNLTGEKKKAFAEEASAMLTAFAPTKWWNRVIRWLGIRVNTDQEVDLRFHELSPAISDPFLADLYDKAA